MINIRHCNRCLLALALTALLLVTACAPSPTPTASPTPAPTPTPTPTSTPTPTPTSTPTPTPTPTKGYSHSNPAPMGRKLSIEHEWLGDTYAFNIMVMQRMRGERAWARIEEVNSSNDLPPPGFEYMLVRIWFQYLAGPTDDTSYWISDFDFTVVSSEGKDYENCFLYSPEPSLDAEIYPGASHHGWAVFMVEEQDEKPLITFGRDYQGCGGIWWQLY